MIGWHGGHTRAHAYRSLLEGVAFELRLHLEGLEAVSGQRITQLRVMGGGSRSPLWTQVVADVTGRTVHLCGDNDEISARGAAVLAWAGAAVGTGTRTATGTATDPGPATTLGERIAAASTSMAASALAGGARRVPRADERAAYDALFPVYRMLYPALRPAFAALRTITDRAARAGSAGAAQHA
jgi:xylulokinase